MATPLHFSHQTPTSTDPTTTASHNLALQTFDSIASFDPPSWQRRLDSEDARLFTATSSTPINTETPDNNPNPVKAFLLTSRRQHPELPLPTLHISLAAVDPSHRGQGLFPRLLAMVEVYAREELGLGGVTICTLPERFPGMFRLLREGRNGWVEVGGTETGDGRKVLFWRGC